MAEEAVLAQWWSAAKLWQRAAEEATRPFYLLRPRLFADGRYWCALYGDDLQIGVCGFGTTPDLAARAFDAAWRSQLTPLAMQRGHATN